VRELAVPLALRRIRPDTLPLPQPPADSLLRPETTPGRGGGGALLAGLLTAGATVLLPAIAGSDEGMTARFAVAGTAGIAGIAGLLRARRPRPIAENVAWNRQLRLAWERDADRVRTQNAELRREVGLVITAGTAEARDLP
jgi:hypothetical protein